MDYYKIIQKTSLLIFHLIVVLSLGSQELLGKTFNDMEATLYFLDDEMLNYKIIYPEKIDQIGEYEIPYRYRIPFLTFNKKEWLILYSDVLCTLYSSDSKIAFWGVAGSFKRIDMFVPGGSYSASSYLVENVIYYKPDNLMLGSLSKPWVEGAEGYGIGESIKIECCI